MRQHPTTTDIPERGRRGGVCSSYITAGYNVREFFACAAMMQQGYRTTATLAFGSGSAPVRRGGFGLEHRRLW
ncbi:hypothetical protein MRX96_046704 [Rhipicephalus microplus]